MTREEAIQVLNMVEAHGALVIEAKRMAIEALKEEPRPTGKWVPYEFGNERWHKCTNCNKPSEYKDRYQAFDGKWYWFERVQNYCPKCGAKMEVEKCKQKQKRQKD